MGHTIFIVQTLLQESTQGCSYEYLHYLVYRRHALLRAVYRDAEGGERVHTGAHTRRQAYQASSIQKAALGRMWVYRGAGTAQHLK